MHKEGVYIPLAKTFAGMEKLKKINSEFFADVIHVRPLLFSNRPRVAPGLMICQSGGTAARSPPLNAGNLVLRCVQFYFPLRFNRKDTLSVNLSPRCGRCLPSPISCPACVSCHRRPQIGLLWLLKEKFDIKCVTLSCHYKG